MQRTDDSNNNGFDVVILIVSAILMTAVVMMCHSCKQYIPVKEVHTDTLYQSRVERDSIYLHDSVHIKERGDTVFYERWHTKYVDKLRIDTLYQSRTDSIPVPYEVIKKEKYTPTFVKVLAWVGAIGIFLFFVIIIKKLKMLL